jgi:hypothetical protein
MTLVQPNEVFCTKCFNPTSAVSFCVNCQTFFCQRHSDSHQASKNGHDHTLSPVSDSVQELSTSSPQCPIHNKPFEAFCKTCFSLCCSTCALSNHKSHNEFIETFFDANEEEEKVTLNFLIDESQKILEQLKTSIHVFDRKL